MRSQGKYTRLMEIKRGCPWHTLKKKKQQQQQQQQQLTNQMNRHPVQESAHEQKRLI